MDFSFNIETVLRCDQNGMLIINSSHKKFMKFDYYYYLEMVINSIGSLSSVQRRLKSPITNADLFFGKQNEGAFPTAVCPKPYQKKDRITKVTTVKVL